MQRFALLGLLALSGSGMLACVARVSPESDYPAYPEYPAPQAEVYAEPGYHHYEGERFRHEERGVRERHARHEHEEHEHHH